MNSAVDLSPIYSQVVSPLALAILSGLGIWLSTYVRQFFLDHAAFLGQQTDKLLADGFQRALQNGTAIAMKQLDQFEGAHTQVEVNSWLAAKAAQYAINHSPDYMARFMGDATPDEAIAHAAEKALAFLPPISVTADTTGTTIKTEQVSVTTLPPPK
jgi:hypothetical protein